MKINMSSITTLRAMKAALALAAFVSMAALSHASTSVGVDLNLGAPAGAPAPPPPPVERPWAPPYATAVWVPGHYVWHHHHYIWYPGYYTYPAPVVAAPVYGPAPAYVHIGGRFH